MIAPRLVNELMLVSVLVGGEGAQSLARSLQEAGAATEILDADAQQSGFDLAILLAAPETADHEDTGKLVAALAQASDRLLFAPLPLRQDGADEAAPALVALTRWFEIFAELGFQPVVDFDAGFVSAGAFLVDRAATAAENELAAFADRLQLLPTNTPPEPQRPVEAASQAELADLKSRLAARDDELAALSATAEESAAALRDAERRNDGWDGLRHWVNMVVADPSRDSEAALRRDLPRLLALRGPDAPPLPLPLPVPRPPARGFLSRLFGRAPQAAPNAAPSRLLEDAALVRASKYFDAAWYIASTPELAEGELVDPVFHYVLVGASRGADPGPWFDTAAYLAGHPDAAATNACALVHAIRSGAFKEPPTI
jgi:hypothetical protein